MDSDTLRKVQLVQLDMLLQVDRICKKHNIKYYLIGGSALGAVRHGGFIPWDEDIDIGMFRKDYETFLSVCGESLNDKYFLQTNKTDLEYPILYAKIRANYTTFVEKESKEMGKKIHQGIFIDIFPIDNVPDSKILARIQFLLVHFFISIASTRAGNFSNNKYKRIIKKLYSYIFIRAFKKETLDSIASNIAAYYKNKPTEKVANLFGRYRTKEIVPRDYFGDSRFIEFEGNYLPIPELYHEYLSQIYGDYMKLPPLEKRSIHNLVYVDLEKSYKEYFN